MFALKSPPVYNRRLLITSSVIPDIDSDRITITAEISTMLMGRTVIMFFFVFELM